MPCGIIILGLNGSGKTTVGRELAQLLNYKRMDVEDYYFPSSGIPFSVHRTKEEVQQLMWKDICTSGNYVLSSVSCDWGEQIIGTLQLAVFLSASLEVRLARIKQREFARFGPRVLDGGDMYESQRRFHDFVASRQEEPIKQTASLLPCPVLEIDSTLSIETIVQQIYNDYLRIQM